MVQFTIAYVALGFALLLMAGAGLAFIPRTRPLSPTERLGVLGGLTGMMALIALAFWLRH